MEVQYEFTIDGIVFKSPPVTISDDLSNSEKHEAVRIGMKNWFEKKTNAAIETKHFTVVKKEG